MPDIARWLAEQGLGHHAEASAGNGVAGDVLCDLTGADLRELGLNLGDPQAPAQGDSGSLRGVCQGPDRHR